MAIEFNGKGQINNFAIGKDLPKSKDVEKEEKVDVINRNDFRTNENNNDVVEEADLNVKMKPKNRYKFIIGILAHSVKLIIFIF